MEGRWFVSNPPKGKVRLDYVSTTRPFPGTKPLSDRRFRQVSIGQRYQCGLVVGSRRMVFSSP